MEIKKYNCNNFMKNASSEKKDKKLLQKKIKS